MRDGFRVHVCHWCFEVIEVCSACDHGRRYCGEGCAKAARDTYKLKAGLAYQQTFEGRLRHAARQQRYRERLKQKVTRQCRRAVAVARIREEANRQRVARAVEAALAKEWTVCHRCKRTCRGPGRRGYRHSPERGPFERWGREDEWWRPPP